MLTFVLLYKTDTQTSAGWLIPADFWKWSIWSYPPGYIGHTLSQFWSSKMKVMVEKMFFNKFW